MSRRVLLAPVTVTPSKPLTPSHLKGLLWTDVMYRATTGLPETEVTYRCSPTPYNLTEQTLGFWEYLDHTHGDIDYRGLTEDDIGRRYVAFRAERRPAPADTLRAYADAVEHLGWVHPAAERVLELWSDHYTRLGLHDPGLLSHQPPGLGLEEMIEALTGLGMCLDQRALGGPAYLDATAYGLPLRQLVSGDGRPNYLACALRDLIPLAPGHDEAVLLYDSGLDLDHQLLQRVLEQLGPAVRRVSLGRVPIEGVVRSARHGNWGGSTAGELLDAAEAAHDKATVRLGMRLYFIATLGPGGGQSFRHELLRQCLDRAQKLLGAVGAAEGAERLARSRGKHLTVDPYRLTCGLLARHRPPAGHDLLSAVFT